MFWRKDFGANRCFLGRTGGSLGWTGVSWKGDGVSPLANRHLLGTRGPSAVRPSIPATREALGRRILVQAHTGGWGISVPYPSEKQLAGRWWLTPIILVTQEAEIRRIEVWANSLWDSISKKPITKIGLVEWRWKLWVQTPVPQEKKKIKKPKAEKVWGHGLGSKAPT
jgi:hypothetical protein